MKDNSDRQKGSALVYILIAIALLAALTATFMDSSSQQTTSQNSYNAVTELKSQINLIRSAIDECVLRYPAGDSGMPAANPVGAQNPVRPYPLMPNNSYMASPTSGPILVNDIRCPGNPGNSNNHGKIFGGTSGRYLPPAPKLYDAWNYYNHTDGVFFYIKTNKSDAFLASALEKVDSEYSKCETQYVNATSTVYLDSANTEAYACGAGYKCLRVWVKPTASAVYPGETGCP
jgi:type II secretory pathway pseudopilin PulG